MNASTTDEYKRERRAVEGYFVESNRSADSRESTTSPSGKYILDIDLYTMGSRGLVSLVVDGRFIADVKRNIGHFPYCWIEHPNGNEYLICGEDYQGYLIINLTQEIVHNYFPQEGLAGHGFCWVDYYPSPDKLILAVEGCIWAAPYEIRFYDFSNPDIVPLSLLDSIGNFDEVIGWETNDMFVFTHDYQVRTQDGVRYDDLSEEEKYELDKDPSLSIFPIETARWQRRVTGDKPNG